MAQVTIKSHAFHDPRLAVAGRSMRLAAPTVGWKLALCWSYVTQANDSVMPIDEVAACIGRKPEVVREGLLHARLAEVHGSDALELEPLRALFGEHEWLSDLEATASAGGKVRAQTAERDEHGRFKPRDLGAEILDLMSDHVSRSASAIIHRLRAGRQGVYTQLTRLVDSGELCKLDNGQYARPVVASSAPSSSATTASPSASIAPAARSSASSSMEPSSAVPRNRFHGEPENPAPSSALAPALAPALASDSVPRSESECQVSTVERFHGTGSTAHSQAVEPESPEPTAEPATGPPGDSLTPERLSTMTEPVPRDERRHIARALWAYQDACRQRIEPSAPAVPLIDAPGGPLDAVMLALAQYSPAQCVHALDVFAAEAQGRLETGQDALQFLNGRTNWKSEPLARAIASTPAAMRKRFKSKTRAAPSEARLVTNLG